MEPTPRYWFPAKRYGWGWGLPRTWQGLAVLVAYLVVVLAPLVLWGEEGAPWSLTPVLVATPLLLWVCLKKGEPPRWRWGRD